MHALRARSSLIAVTLASSETDTSIEKTDHRVQPRFIRRGGLRWRCRAARSGQLGMTVRAGASVIGLPWRSARPALGRQWLGPATRPLAGDPCSMIQGSAATGEPTPVRTSGTPRRPGGRSGAVGLGAWVGCKMGTAPAAGPLTRPPTCGPPSPRPGRAQRDKAQHLTLAGGAPVTNTWSATRVMRWPHSGQRGPRRASPSSSADPGGAKARPRQRHGRSQQEGWEPFDAGQVPTPPTHRLGSVQR